MFSFLNLKRIMICEMFLLLLVKVFARNTLLTNLLYLLILLFILKTKTKFIRFMQDYLQ